MHTNVLTFWFDEIDSAKWWHKDPDFDAVIRARFAALHAAAELCELFAWRESSQGRLAEIIVLDQFSRNLHRNSARAFANDALALALSQEAIAADAHRDLAPIERGFLYMPFMHSESPRIHATAEALFGEVGIPSMLDAARQHRAIIERFGRYPHRNAVLGRQSTPEELTFLEQPGSSF